VNNSDNARVQWFPGHMAKTRRLMKENLALVDIVLEVLDARIPVSSRNPEIDSMLSRKPRIILLNKADVADEQATKLWLAYFEKRGLSALAVDCRGGKGLAPLYPLIREKLKDTYARLEARGMQGRPMRVMVVGIPNCGKSSLINRLSRGKKAKVEDRPGVTRGKQWVTLDTGIEVLDMPGVLWPKFDDPKVGEYLAFTGAVKDDILDIETLAVRLLACLRVEYGELLEQRYKITVDPDLQDYELLEAIAKSRGMLLRGGEYNTERASIMLLDEFRAGAIGRITLERPEQE